MNVPPIVKILSQSVYGHGHKNQITWFENVGVTPQEGVVTYYDYQMVTHGGMIMCGPRQIEPPTGLSK